MITYSEFIQKDSKSGLFHKEKLSDSYKVFLIAASKLNIHPNECLVIEDSDAGVIAGYRGGMKTLAIGIAKNNKFANYSSESLANIKIESLL